MRTSRQPTLSPANTDVRIGRDELNLCEFPITLLSKTDSHIPADPKTGVKAVVFIDEIEGRAGKPVQRKWQITGSMKYGLPTVRDEDVYVALLELTKEYRFQSRSIPFSLYELIHRVGWHNSKTGDAGGREYDRLKESLYRWVGVTFYVENAFYDRRTDSYASQAFHLLESVTLLDQRPPRHGSVQQLALPLSRVVWNDVIWESFQQNYMKKLDVGFYFSLQSRLARRIYRYLDKKRLDGKTSFAIGLDTLTITHLGLAPDYNSAQIKRLLQPAHEELSARGFLHSISYQPMSSRRGEKVVYTFARRQELEEVEAVTNDLIRALVGQGVSEGVAKQLFEDYGSDAVHNQLIWLPYRKNVEDPAAVLVEAIRHSWAEPISWKREQGRARKAEQKAEERAKVAQEKAQAQEASEAEKRAVQSVFEGLAPAEREALAAEVAEILKERNPWLSGRGKESPAWEALAAAELKRIVKERYADEFASAYTMVYTTELAGVGKQAPQTPAP